MGPDMLHEFLDANRTELVDRCRAKVALRRAPRPTPQEMEYGIPLFLGQLIETLRSEQCLTAPELAETASGPKRPALRLIPSEIADTAAKHGHELLRHGFSVDQVVHDYGDLCQAVTELALETNAAVSVDEFHTLNRCLDNAIADAVTEFEGQRDRLMSETGNRELNERLGFLAHEQRNFLNTAMMSFAAMKRGGVGLDGATSAVLDRSLIGLRGLIDSALADVRLNISVPSQLEPVSMDRFIAEIQVAATLDATARGCEFTVWPVEPRLEVYADRQLIHSAVSNLLQNAFKFTRACTHVSLNAYAKDDRVLIEVQDQCGGLPKGKAEAMFRPFEQYDPDRSGLGLGLTISRRAVEASGGLLYVRDMPGVGCIFTVDLPRRDITVAGWLDANGIAPPSVPG
jgi:signal transduction histidine kinase